MAWAGDRPEAGQLTAALNAACGAPHAANARR
ncbi:hypothetical protein [Dactylosporangium sp. CA-092794]